MRCYFYTCARISLYGVLADVPMRVSLYVWLYRSATDRHRRPPNNNPSTTWTLRPNPPPIRRFMLSHRPEPRPRCAELCGWKKMEGCVATTSTFFDAALGAQHRNRASHCDGYVCATRVSCSALVGTRPTNTRAPMTYSDHGVWGLMVGTPRRDGRTGGMMFCCAWRGDRAGVGGA